MANEIPHLGRLAIEVRHTEGRTVVELSGELDLATAPALYERLADIPHHEVAEVVLDLTALEFIDSVGLSVVIAEHKRMLTSGGALVLQSPTPRARKLFEVSGLSSFLDIRPASAPTEPSF